MATKGKSKTTKKKAAPKRGFSLDARGVLAPPSAPVKGVSAAGKCQAAFLWEVAGKKVIRSAKQARADKYLKAAEAVVTDGRLSRVDLVYIARRMGKHLGASASRAQAIKTIQRAGIFPVEGAPATREMKAWRAHNSAKQKRTVKRT